MQTPTRAFLCSHCLHHSFNARPASIINSTQLFQALQYHAKTHSNPFNRLFSTTKSKRTKPLYPRRKKRIYPKLTQTTNLIPRDAPPAPPYPYEPNHHYYPANTGLYGSTTLQHGHNVSSSDFNTKTLRVWHPNVVHKNLYSKILARSIKLKVSTRALRSIDKVGGLDEYILGSSTSQRVRELGPEGWQLRWALVCRGLEGRSNEVLLGKIEGDRILKGMRDYYYDELREREEREMERRESEGEEREMEMERQMEGNEMGMMEDVEALENIEERSSKKLENELVKPQEKEKEKQSTLQKVFSKIPGLRRWSS